VEEDHNAFCDNELLITFVSDYYGVTDFIMYHSNIVEIENISKMPTVAIGIIKICFAIQIFGGKGSHCFF